MPFKPNYRQQRNDRNRVKDQKRQEKQQRREEKAADRRAVKEAPQEPAAKQDEATQSAQPG
jgi:hypothetical protein